MSFQVFTLKKQKINRMSKNFKPILIVAGDPKSVFLKLFFKTLKKFKKNQKILIASKRLIIDQLKLLKMSYSIQTLNIKKKINYKNLDNKKINLIDVPFDYKNFENIKLKNTNKYIKKCFDVAINLLNSNKKLQLINGPIVKKIF